jgi:hypothetical protein
MSIINENILYSAFKAGGWKFEAGVRELLSLMVSTACGDCAPGRYSEARSLLIASGIHPSHAEKLVREKYESYQVHGIRCRHDD